jgi:porin
MRFTLIPSLMALVFWSSSVFAQDNVDTDGQKPHSHIHAPGEIDENQAPFIVDVTYTFDVWQAAKGGIRKGARYLDNLDVVAEADMEELVGWKGAEIHVYGLYNNGKSLNALMGDAQVASNIETGVKAVRLYEAWVDQKIGEKASVKIGLYDLNSEFDALDASGLFMGSAHGIGTDISQTGLNGPSIFPSTSLAARLEIEPAKRWKIRAAVLDGVPGDPNRPKRTAVNLSGKDGALIIGELEAPLGKGKLLLGHWRYTSPFDAWQGGRGRGNDGWYVRGETPLSGTDIDTDGRGLAAFFRFGIADGAYNPFNLFLASGLNYTGLIKGREEDQLGVAFATARTSNRYRLTTPADRAETVVELTYRAPITKWLTIQPNVQYVINPGVEPSLRDALAFGLRTELTIRLQ